MSDTNNLSDIAIYQSSDENVLQGFHDFASKFADCIVNQEWHGAYQFLATWLQDEMTPDDLRLAFDAKLLEMNSYWKIEELIYPSSYSIDYNSCSLQQIKEPMSWRESRKISDSLTQENFQKWMVIQYMPDENDFRTEFDAWFDFWFVVAKIKDELRIGYFEFGEPD